MIDYKDLMIMWLDEECTHIVLDETNSPISVERLVTDIPKQRFNNESISKERFYDLLCERFFDESRPDKIELLNLMSLNFYNPWEIVKKTHGVLTEDKCWIKFKGESLCWKDISNE